MTSSLFNNSLMANISIYFLFLLAVIAGWLLGRYGSRRPGATNGSANTSTNTSTKVRSARIGRDSFEDYFVGLNYLINDEPDEAIDTFIKALEVNGDTIETHLALGALLRRRGKVDKAIQVHQSLLARPGLDRGFSDSARLQLAIDYISAGLLDRAERLLNEILNEGSPIEVDVLKHLITIYQLEKEWEKAIVSSARLLADPSHKNDLQRRAAAAHYCCELAEQLSAKGQNSEARLQLKKAFSFDRKSVRAPILLAKIEQQQGNHKAAIRELVRVNGTHPEITSQLLEPLAVCHEELGSMKDFEKLLVSLLPAEPDISVLRALSELIEKHSEDFESLQFLSNYMHQHPSLFGLAELLRLQLAETEPDPESNLQQIQQMLDKLLLEKSAYQCIQCGYETKSLYWLCPSCKKWDTIKPVSAMLGY